jgi:hypothetical protein
MNSDRLGRLLITCLAALLLLPAAPGLADQPKMPGAGPAAAASDLATFFGEVGDRLYEEDCIFELSEEQLDVQDELIKAYMKHGAPSTLARQLAVKQIPPPDLSERCQQIRSEAKKLPPPSELSPPSAAKPPPPAKRKPGAIARKARPAPKSLAGMKVLPQWDCGPGIDYVTIQHKGYDRKLTGGEICNPYEDVVRQVPQTAGSFRLGYTIRTGRLFVISDDPQINGKTIAWAISGRDICRNNPDPDCLAARAVGPLPPGEYAFASDKDDRVSWGPRSKRMVAGIYLTKLWNKDNFTPAQTAAILARGNIAIHVRLKGEMSEACLGLEPKGWAYVSSLIKDGRATGVNVYIDEPHPRVAEKPPVVRTSSFSLSSLFN